ncbi:MAG: hypothetical protein C4313_11065 [Thermoflexus sp.]
MMEENLDEAEITARLRQQADRELQAAGADPAFYDVAASYENIVAGYLRYWRKRLGAAATPGSPSR